VERVIDAHTLQVAVLGLGNVAEPHLTAYQALEHVHVVGVVEPRLERRAQIAADYGVRAYPTCAALFAACQPHIVCILTPAQTHRALTEQCAASGVHVLCEKPMAVTLEDALAMRRACDEAGVNFFYGSSYRYLPAVRAAKALIQSGTIGAVRLIVEQSLGGAGAQAYRELSATHYPEGGPGGGGYGLVDHGIHMLDVFPWLCDTSISTVFGRGDRTGNPARPEFALLNLANGATGALLYDGSTRPAQLPGEGVFSSGQQWLEGRGWMGDSNAWDSQAGSIQVYGSEGTLRLFHYANKLYVNRDGSFREHPLPHGTTPWHFGFQLEDFWKSLQRKQAPPISAADGIRALAALLAIYKSEAQGSWQQVQDVKP
jgi:predicted dehydrogenase